MHVFKETPSARGNEVEKLHRALVALRSGDTDVRLPERPGIAGQAAAAFNEVAAMHAEVVTELKRLRRSRGTNGKGRATREKEQEREAALNGEGRAVLAALVALKRGDCTAKLPVSWSGDIGRVAEAFNDVVEINIRCSRELQRLSRVVGTEGRLKQRASLGDVSGFWRESVDAVNSLIDDLVQPTTEVARVIGAFAQGDLTKQMALEVDGRPLQGEFLRTARTINRMVEQLGTFSNEITRVAREIGFDGTLGGQITVKGLSGTWKDLTESVNSMAQNVTDRLRNIAEVTTAVAVGDLSRKITVDVKGEILELKNTINTMVDQLRSFASEVTRVAREVGTEGMLGGQARVEGVSGTWKDLTDSVNFMASNLTSQVRNIAEVTTAVAAGDLSKKITVDVKGEILELKNTVNTMVDQLSSFAAEVTRVAREVGTEGELGGQADVKGVAGTWKDLTESVNSMASNLTGQVRNIAEVTTAVAAGDLSKKITVDVKGELLELKNTVNTMVDQLSSFAAEVTRVAREVGTEGKLGGQAQVRDVSGTWKDLTDSVNSMASNLTAQVRNIAEVTTAVAVGDLSKKITVDVKGEILELKNTVNTMVDQLRSFASEVTRVAREVGTEGMLGGQARVEGISGTWKDLTDNVNFMASNLTSQVRGIAKVVTAVADGDLSQKLMVEAKGEIAALAYTINSMTDTLATFAAQVTTVAREVGVEGKLGGQAKVPGASGTWKGLTENVNQLAANLTTQVRAIAEVATAVTQGDLTRSITVQAQGEVAALKDTINEMIRNLKDTTQKNTEQDWLKTNLAKFSRMLQGQKDLVTVGRMILAELAPVVGAQQAEVYVLDTGRYSPRLRLVASYASGGQSAHGKEVDLGAGLVGQCAVDQRKILLNGVPAEAVRISSGLSEGIPCSILVLPVVFEGQVKGVVELASFERFSSTHLTFLDLLMESIGIVINTIEANMRTENLLQQSQSLAQELQQTNQELQEKARLLAHQNQEVERKNQEVEQARQALEDKAKQLALTSKYKSEFLANMSHELRTPLNSLLILSDQLTRNVEGNLSDKQVEFARTIHASGNDLLMLINDILDLSKIESGTVVVDAGELRLDELRRYVERNFRHVAEAKNVGFVTHLDERLPKCIVTDAKRLQQILKNLLSNAFKFTHRGQVTLNIAPGETGNAALPPGGAVIAFSVTDTGIGISLDKQQIIFEAFQQADGSTSRKYGGTGLGLAISRELSKLLGGEIRLESSPGKGSAFTLFLPTTYDEPWAARARAASANALAPASEPSRMESDSDRTEEGATWPLVNEVEDDRDDIQPGNRVLLIVENDLAFARILLDAARAKGFKGLVTSLGRGALALASDYSPDAITLDLFLPDLDGWRVLGRLKNDLNTRHVPICVISTDDSRSRAFDAGAAGFVAKPVESKDVLDRTLDGLRTYIEHTPRQLVIAMPDSPERDLLVQSLAGEDVEVIPVSSGELVAVALRQGTVHAMIVDAALSGLDASDIEPLLERRNAPGPLPVLFHGDGSVPVHPAFRARLKDLIVAFDAHSRPRLIDLAAFVLHRDVACMPEERRRELVQLHEFQQVLTGRKVLIVDDDMRNIFALATVLDEQGMSVLSAENGQEAIQHLKTEPAIDIVLMDIMMPDMDGIATIREIRRIPGRRELPIVAVTAKAMKGDREKCIEAGAWDYLSKPVDIMDLLVVLRAWLHR